MAQRNVFVVYRVKKKKTEYNIPYKFHGGKLYWMSYNFRNHLKKFHKLTPKNEDLSKKRKKNIESASLGDKNNRKKHSDATYIDKSKPFEIQDKAQNFTIEESAIIEEIDENDQLIEEINLDYIRSKLYDQINNQMLKMKEQCDMNDETLYNMEFMCGDKKYDLQIGLIVPDGNCLFSALAHQIFDSKLNSDELATQSIDMRADVMQCLNDNSFLFEADILGSISDKHVNDEDKENAYKNYLCQLSNDGIWGGVEVYRAVGLIHKVNILVVNQNSTFYFPHGFDVNLEKTLIIAYKSNVHYDSIVHIDAPYVFQIVEDILSKCEVKQFNECNTVNKSNMDNLNTVTSIKFS